MILRFEPGAFNPPIVSNDIPLISKYRQSVGQGVKPSWHIGGVAIRDKNTVFVATPPLKHS